ncbi:hypothetical protein LZD49_11625 [Dyadobacter sp. CY261]|uniref:hypothetical protein n=1 Tax=Dyadobacter sp. CY261 TaxID=2907203 RepID=UPI001F39FACA|nr:hypothetical protein [Dyadobacter sp. CY261]MCF0071120.1 hypothetical protein [Dyadobacter sp. CY261]
MSLRRGKMTLADGLVRFDINYSRQIQVSWKKYLLLQRTHDHNNHTPNNRVMR